LQNTKIASNTDTAFVTLFRQWQEDYTKLTGKTACERAALRGLACLYKTGTWEELRTLNRPAILELVTDDGRQHHAVVTQLQKDVATLVFGESTFNFTLSEINQYWLGRLLLLWQPPKLPIPVVKAGITNPAVVWLRKHLEKAEGRSSLATYSANFDNALRKRLIAFQQQHGIGADGVAGEQTMVVLQAFATEGPGLK
jgi:general secretion pathway protein A